MIKNCTILRITNPVPASAGSEVTWTPAVETLSGLRCAQTAPTRRQVFQLGAVIKDATAVIRVLRADLERVGVSIAENDQVETQVDRRDASETFRVIKVTDTEKSGGLSSVVAFLQKQ